MTYASHNRRPNPAALAGALGIPAAVGAFLVVGLAVTVVIAPVPPRIQGETITQTPLPPPPPPTPDTSAKTDNRTTPRDTSTSITRPDNIPVDLGTSGPIATLPGTGDLVGPVDFGIPEPTPSASPFDAVAAKARGNPSKWVTNNDYRPRWIREGLTGSARFTLAIDAGGKVTGCTITRSTGHPALDMATCELVTKRAQFDGARDGNGKPVAGNYSSTITWNIP